MNDDPKLCWNCGRRGIPSVGSRLVCPECEVTWMPVNRTARLLDQVAFMGDVIPAVDFTTQDALPSPA